MTTLLLVVALMVGLSAAVPAVARWASAVLPPARAVALSVSAAVAAATGTGLALSAVAAGYLGTAAGHWAGRRGPAGPGAVPVGIGLAAVLLTAGLLAAGCTRAAVLGRSVVRAHRAGRALPGDGPVAFVDDADVYTLAGLPGRVVIGTRLYDRLPPGDRSVVAAHEHSHLRRRHHLYLHAVDVAAAANPLLRPVRETVRLGVERWADEDAAAAVGDRRAAALALARVALERQRLHRSPGAGGPAPVLAVATRHVTARVQALLDPPLPARSSWAVTVTAVFVAAAVVAAATLASTDDLLHVAPLHLHHR
ncbi:M56 family peptidase [Nakamurella endophytica]|uniref:Uncharacterized protein n=1 Tax=Nakamurella endophytica TaxID=1748367 RepID=A0A917SX36_9ACTN|nr:M56 family peptidase [Nakamurella endophytica]GGM00530.1 hypothetical protein GCM10011594_20780 [Nakamurella endophytica]